MKWFLKAVQYLQNYTIDQLMEKKIIKKWLIHAPPSALGTVITMTKNRQTKKGQKEALLLVQ